MSQLTSINGNKTKEQWKIANVKNGFLPDLLNAVNVDATKNFSSQDIVIELNSPYNVKITDLYFVVGDRLVYGDGTIITGANIARNFNHISCLWDTITVEINDTIVENISNVAELDAYEKYRKYNKSWFDSGLGFVQGCSSFSARANEAATFKAVEKIWKPDCSQILTSEIPQNARVKITLKPHKYYDTRAVQLSSGVNAPLMGNTNATVKYIIESFSLRYKYEEAEVAPTNYDYVMDLRPVEMVTISQLNTALGTEQYAQLNVKSTTYELGLGFSASNKDSSLWNKPNNFKSLPDYNGNDRSLMLDFYMNYAGQKFPEHANNLSLDATNKSIKGYPTMFYESMLANDKHFNDAGTIYFADWLENKLWSFNVVKREDDASTALELYFRPQYDLTSSGTSTNAHVFYKYSQVVILKYDAQGNIISVSKEVV